MYSCYTSVSISAYKTTHSGMTCSLKLDANSTEYLVKNKLLLCNNLLEKQ